MFYLVIYWMRKVNNYFIFLCSHHCHLSATLQTISITVANLQDNWTGFRNFIALLKFSFDSPSYLGNKNSYFVFKTFYRISFIFSAKFFVFHNFISLVHMIFTFYTTNVGDRGATNRKVPVSIPDGVVGIFNWHNPSDRTMALGSTQPLTEMSTRSISWR